MNPNRTPKEVKAGIFKGLDEAISISKNLDKKKNSKKKDFDAVEMAREIKNKI